MILMLLNYSKSWSQNNNGIALRASNYKSDTIIQIKLNYIREANAKLIERKYLIEINNEKDSIINLSNNYIKEQNAIIDTLQNRIIKYQNINNNLQENLSKKKYNVKLYSIGVLLLGIIVGLTIN